MAIGPGTRLGPYEITALLGEGGMGKVWRAHHTGLKRDDALKVLPDAFSRTSGSRYSRSSSQRRRRRRTTSPKRSGRPMWERPTPRLSSAALLVPCDGEGFGGRDYLASGSGRTWNFITLLVVPLPVSMWNGALVETVVQMPRPFQPALGSSMRPSIHLV